MSATLDESLGSQTGKTSRSITRLLNAYLKHYDITLEQWVVIRSVFKTGGANQMDLAAIADKDKATLARILDILKEKGFVKKTVNVQDRRSFLISLTEKGRELYEAIVPNLETVYQSIFANFSEQELQVYKKVLGKIHYLFNYADRVCEDEKEADKFLQTLSHAMRKIQYEKPQDVDIDEGLLAGVQAPNDMSALIEEVAKRVKEELAVGTVDKHERVRWQSRLGTRSLARRNRYPSVASPRRRVRRGIVGARSQSPGKYSG